MTSSRGGRKLGPTPGGGMEWYVPNRKRVVACTTVSTGTLIDVVVEDRGQATFRELRDVILYDSDATKLCDIMIDLGWGDEPLVPVSGHGVQFVKALSMAS